MKSTRKQLKELDACASGIEALLGDKDEIMLEDIPWTELRWDDIRWGARTLLFTGRTYGKTQAYWRDGKLHRDDGPAVICASGTEEYWRDGVQQ